MRAYDPTARIFRHKVDFKLRHVCAVFVVGLAISAFLPSPPRCPSFAVACPRLVSHRAMALELPDFKLTLSNPEDGLSRQLGKAASATPQFFKSGSASLPLSRAQRRGHRSGLPQYTSSGAKAFTARSPSA
jgi:hypothetical protein